MAGKKIDLLGKVFGYLTIIEYAGPTKKGSATWKCLCDCGNIKIIRTDHLINKESMSCGCKKSYFMKSTLSKNRQYRIGQTFNDLTIIEYIKYDRKANASLYKCKCTCGKVVIRRLVALASGVSNSCGCKNGEKRSLAKGGTGIPGELDILQVAIRKCVKYSHFIKAALIAANYKSQLSGITDKLHVHHIISISSIIKTKNLTKINFLLDPNLFNINNAFVLTEQEHIQFHKLYGTETNKQQLIEFIEAYQNGTKCN